MHAVDALKNKNCLTSIFFLSAQWTTHPSLGFPTFIPSMFELTTFRIVAAQLDAFQMASPRSRSQHIVSAIVYRHTEHAHTHTEQPHRTNSWRNAELRGFWNAGAAARAIFRADTTQQFACFAIWSQHNIGSLITA